MKKRRIRICIIAAGGIASGCISFHGMIHAGMVMNEAAGICLVISVLMEILAYILAEGVSEAYMCILFLSMAASIALPWVTGQAGLMASYAMVLFLPYALMALFYIGQRILMKTNGEEKDGRIYLQ